MYLMVVLLLASGPNAGSNYCELCHSDVKVEFQSSIHENEGLTCVSCHGGDPSRDTVQQAHGGSFKSLKSRKDVPESCATCHSDSEKMRAYGLPTDQMALYSTSVHGKRLAKGDENVAICTDCHGVHKMLPPSDPASLTHPRNIPTTCGRCHANAELMAQYKLPGTIVAEYESGVHGKALLAGNQQAPVCTSCHGTHGAAPPGIGDVSIVCGHCHEAVRDYFRASPHQKAMAQAGIPECAGCHGNHKIEKSSHQMWSTTCQECHKAGGEEVTRGRKMQDLLSQADLELSKAGDAVDEASKVPLDVSDYEAGLEEARTYLVQALPVTHSLKTQDVEDLTRRAHSIGVEIQAEVKGENKVFGGRRIVLALVLFYILLTIVIIYRYRKVLERKDQEPPLQ